MSENAKKGLLIGAAVLAAIVAVFGAMNFLNLDKPQVGDNVIQIPEGSRSMKDIEMEKQEAQKAGMQNGGQPQQSDGGEKDLSGDLTPKPN